MASIPVPRKKTTLSPREWEEALSTVPFSKAAMNALIMNYLVVEGFKDAADQFARESGTVPAVNTASIQDRMAIRQAVQAGRIDDAIAQVNDLDPEILDANTMLSFRLQQQKLIEMIREGRVADAIAYAQEELAPRGESNPACLRETEKTMALLAFEDAVHSPVGYLLSPQQRQNTASELNAAILTAQSQDRDPKLPGLLQLLFWSQDQLDERNIDYPKI
ncbi:hypothetical protein CXG81DRAFT_850, partial [Caulochytrium protostelioides]